MDTNLNVIILRGLPASGKSTWAKEQLEKFPGKYKVINKDLLRLMLDNSKHSNEREKFVLKFRDAIMLQSLADGYSVIIDDTNFAPKHEARIRQLVKDKAEVI